MQMSLLFFLKSFIIRCKPLSCYLCLCATQQSLTWLSIHLTSNHHMPGSRCPPPTSSVSWVSAPRCCSTPAVCMTATSATVHRSSLWTAAHITPPTPAPTTASPVTKCVSKPKVYPCQCIVGNISRFFCFFLETLWWANCAAGVLNISWAGGSR